MSNKTMSDGFEWDELWAAFNGQPNFIQRAWFIELCKPDNLPRAVKQSKRYRDEIFENAPEWAKEYFGLFEKPKDDDSRMISMLMRI